MTIGIEFYPDDQTIVVVYQEPLNPLVDVAYSNKAVWDFHYQLGQPFYVLYDVDAVDISFVDVVQILSVSFKGDHNIAELPLTIYAVFERTNPMIELAVKTLRGGLYGSFRVNTAPTSAAALTEIRQQRTPDRAGYGAGK
jgi:hypothetical protein